MKIGFSGLGQMGKHMAMNMLKSGAEVIVSDVRSDSFHEFEQKGAQTTTDFGVAAKADIVFLSLPSGQIVESVLLGENGVLRNPKKGQIVVDTSTITYSTTMEIAKRLRGARDYVPRCTRLGHGGPGDRRHPDRHVRGRRRYL